MASPLRRHKQTVDLAASGRKVSRIRRDPPPPPPRKVSPGELRTREAKVIVVGMLAFAVAIAAIMFHVAHWAGWSPADYVIVVSG